MALTRRQREIFDFISAFVEEQGYSPSLEEIATQFGLSSVATVHRHVQHLVEKGLLRKAWNRSRSLEPVPQEEDEPGLTMLPLVGTVAAGAPIEAIEVHERIAVPADMAGRPGECFVLRVRGDSMISAGIFDGDFVVVRVQPTAELGEIVVAGIPGDEGTVKRLHTNSRTEIILKPENPALELMVFAPDQVTIFGKVVTVMRKL